MRSREHQLNQVGWIPYLNLLPLKHELLRSLGSTLQLKKGHPSSVNRWLTEGEVILAPSSSVCLLKNATHEMAFPLGIASQGPVQSVYLGLPRELAHLTEALTQRTQALGVLFREALSQHPENMRAAAQMLWDVARDLPQVELSAPAIKLSTASASSAALVRVLYRLWFGESAYRVQFGNGAPESYGAMPAAELVIGDEALIRRPSFAAIVDLGSVWYQMTGLPFVFAVWQKARTAVPPTWRARFFEAAELAQARMQVEPSIYYPDNIPSDVNGNPIDLASYWQGLHYRLGCHDLRGLLLYLSLSRYLLKHELDDSIVVKMLRWQQLSGSAAAQPS